MLYNQSWKSNNPKMQKYSNDTHFSFFSLNLGFFIGVLSILIYQNTNNNQPVALDKDTIQVYFTYPKAFRSVGFVTCESVIVSLINNSKKSIKVLAYNWTSVNIANAIAAAHRRGVEVRIILDKENQSRENEAVVIVNNNSSELNIRSISGISHNKVMIIDDSIVCTGSYNFSKAANERNDENLLVIRSAEVATRYTTAWNKIRECVHKIYEERRQLKKWNEGSLRNSNYKNKLNKSIFSERQKQMRR